MGWLDNIEKAQSGITKEIDSTLNANQSKLGWIDRLYDKDRESIQLEGEQGTSTHYMSQIDNYAVPLVDTDSISGKLKYTSNPDSKYIRDRGIKFPSDKKALDFSRDYKKGTNVLKEHQDGGIIEAQEGEEVRPSWVKDDHKFPQPQELHTTKDEDVARTKEIKDARLKLHQMPLHYLTNPNHLVGDFIDGVQDIRGQAETRRTNWFGTSRDDAREYERLSGIPGATLDKGLQMAPWAALNVGLGMATAVKPGLLPALNETVNPLAGTSSLAKKGLDNLKRKPKSLRELATETGSKYSNSPLSKEMEPYLSKYEKPISREQEVFENSFHTYQQQKYIDDRTVHLSNKGEITNKKFASEINWSKFNKDIPGNKPLMKEYAAIEQAAKADGTWMKNPNGSAFQGKPEQFVQQNSDNFKKAFNNSKIVNKDGTPKIVYHGGRKNIEAFLSPSDEAFRLNEGMNSATKDFGIYFAGDKNIAKRYLKGHAKDNRQIYETYLDVQKPYESSFFQNNFPFSKKSFKPTRISKENKHVMGDSDGTIWRPPYGEYSVMKPTQIKSAAGNNGMFDMTNPNIYKAVVPTVIGGGTAASQITEPKQENGQFKSGGWIDKYQDGGVIKDDKGYWNPDNHGKAVEINSNDITMQGVDQPLVGVSDTGDVQYMEPGKDYKFKGKKVTEYPVAQDGTVEKKVKTANTFTNMLGNVGKYFFDKDDKNLKESQYRPTIESHKNSGKKEKYYSRPGMKADVYNDLTSERVKKDYNHDGSFNDIHKGLKSNGKDREHNANNAFPKNQAGYKGQYNRGHGSLIGEFNLGRYRTDAGKDKNGRYISFVDKYDWNGMKTENAINFYDRIYENDWDEFKEQARLEEQNAGRKLKKLMNSPTLKKLKSGGTITEYPMAKSGGWIDNLQNKNKLSNFTGHNATWLNKYTTS